MSGTPFERGAMYGNTQANEIKQYYLSKTHEFSHLTKEWKAMASAQMVQMQRYTPIAYEEMTGTASADPDLTLDMLMELTIFPELEAFDHFHACRCDRCGDVIQTEQWMQCTECDEDVCTSCHSAAAAEGGFTSATCKSTQHTLTQVLRRESQSPDKSAGKKCSSFVRVEPGYHLSGQTDEENPAYNQHGLLHSVQHVTDEAGMQSLLYTAPGTPCMTGMNSKGLTVLANTLFVPDNRFWDGVPTLAATREVLTKGTLEDAVAFIGQIPLAIPLNFVLSQPGHGCCNLEASHVELAETRTTEGLGAVYIHCNHCLTQGFMEREELPIPAISTQQRQQVLQGCIDKARKGSVCMDLEWLKQAFLKPPVNNSFVIATIIMEPTLGALHIRFGTPTVPRGKKRKKIGSTTSPHSSTSPHTAMRPTTSPHSSTCTRHACSASGRR